MEARLWWTGAVVVTPAMARIVAAVRVIFKRTCMVAVLMLCCLEAVIKNQR
jgi:hypothetical protein